MAGSIRSSIGFFLLLFVAPAASPAGDGPPNRSHARTLQGTVVSWDEARRALAIRDSRGNESRFALTRATRVSGGQLAVGAGVTVRWVPRDRQSVATAIRVHPQEAAGAAPSPAPTPPTPTPGAR